MRNIVVWWAYLGLVAILLTRAAKPIRFMTVSQLPISACARHSGLRQTLQSFAASMRISRILLSKAISGANGYTGEKSARYPNCIALRTHNEVKDSVKANTEK